MAKSRLYPSLRSHSYLVLDSRRRLLEAEAARLRKAGKANLVILDVGGHDKPYAPIFMDLCKNHLAMDLDGRKADLVGMGEMLPMKDDSVDAVLCTQVLEHVRWPADVVAEIHRVLKRGGVAFISVPCVFPLHGSPYDNWRFMAGGVRVLLEAFSEVRVMAEGGSVASFFRTLNMYLWIFTGRRWSGPLRPLLEWVIFPANNLAGKWLDRWFNSGDQFASNWLAVAVK